MTVEYMPKVCHDNQQGLKNTNISGTYVVENIS